MPQNASASASAFQFLDIFFISTPAIQFPGHFTAAFLTVRCYLFDLQFIANFNQIIISIILTLQTFLQLNYQGIQDQKDSPFTTHPIAMTVAISSFAVYFFSYTAMIRFPHHPLASLAHHLLVSSGYIAVATLSSVLLPDTAAPFLYAIFGLLAAAELLLWLHRKLIEEEDEVEFWIQRWRIRRFFTETFGNLGRFYGERARRLQV